VSDGLIDTWGGESDRTQVRGPTDVFNRRSGSLAARTAPGKRHRSTERSTGRRILRRRPYLISTRDSTITDLSRPHRAPCTAHRLPLTTNYHRRPA